MQLTTQMLQQNQIKILMPATVFFFELVVHCHIIAAALQYLGMYKLDDTPSANVIPDPDNTWMLPEEERKKQLYLISEGIIQ